jgi:hypothetical protein
MMAGGGIQDIEQADEEHGHEELGLPQYEFEMDAGGAFMEAKFGKHTTLEVCPIFEPEEIPVDIASKKKNLKVNMENMKREREKKIRQLMDKENLMKLANT